MGADAAKDLHAEGRQQGRLCHAASVGDADAWARSGGNIPAFGTWVVAFVIGIIVRLPQRRCLGTSALTLIVEHHLLHITVHKVVSVRPLMVVDMVPTAAAAAAAATVLLGAGRIIITRGRHDGLNATGASAEEDEWKL
jgi:hypothetical protein